MTTPLRDRFRQVDLIPTPWDERAPAAPRDTPPGPWDRRRRSLVLGTAAAVVAVAVVVVSLVVQDARAPRGDASWLVDAQQSCVEQYSVDSLAARSYAFEGVISDVHGPTDPDSADPAGTTTTIAFDVVRWFWGGSGAEASRRTYAVVSSVGKLDGSIGAELLVAGDEDFVWSCGFTQAATRRGRTEFETAAARRGP